MFLSSVNMDYRKKLVERIKEVLEFLRAAFADNKVMLKDINETFEDTLVFQLNLIPKTWIAGFYESVEMVIDIAKSVNPQLLHSAVTKHQQSRLWFEIDSYNVFMTHCVKNQGVDKNIVAAIDNIASQLKPICVLVDYLFKHPDIILENICEYVHIEDCNNDIFN